MFDRLEAMLLRYDEITKMLMDPDIVKDIKKMTALSKEQASLAEAVEIYKKFKDLKEEQGLAEELLKEETDEEMLKMAREEIKETNKKLEEYEEKLHILLIPKDPNDEKNVMVEIRGAAGGDEANLFAGDLFRMYSRYAEQKGWKIEVANYFEGEAGGVSKVEFMIKGENIYKYMKFESGAHRVQRVPKTESAGRIHTSTATVLVMPEAEEIDFDLDMNDVRIDIFCSSGPGGQSVNTTKSAVRVTHIPTGIVASCQDGKSQHENKASALRMLRTRIYDHILQEKEAEDEALRKTKIGTGDRSEKIRTYNYPQNRVTDHRIGFTIQQLDKVMDGKLDPIIEALMNEEQKRLLKGE